MISNTVKIKVLKSETLNINLLSILSFKDCHISQSMFKTLKKCPITFPMDENQTEVESETIVLVRGVNPFKCCFSFKNQSY